MDKKEKLKYLLGLPLLVVIGFITVTKGAFPDTDISKKFRYDESRIVHSEKIEMEKSDYTEIFYDGKDRKVKEVVAEADTDIIKSETKYSYKSNGSYIQLVDNNPGGENGSVVFNCYDKDGVLKEYYICMNMGSAGYVNDLYGKNEYDENGNLLTTTEYKIYLRRLEEVFRTEYVYDRQNRMTEKTVSSEGVITSRTGYEYDPDRIINYIYVNGKQTYRTEQLVLEDYPADEIPDFLKSFIYTDGSIVKTEDLGLSINYYDVQGRIIRRYESAKSGVGTDIFYMYRHDGTSVMKEQRAVNPTSITFTTYDANGYSTGKYTYKNHGAGDKAFVLDGFEIYKSKNNNGSYNEKSRYSYDGKLLYKWIKEVDRQHRDIREVTYYSSGNASTEKQWQYDPRIETEITYNYNGGRRRKEITYFESVIIGYSPQPVDRKVKEEIFSEGKLIKDVVYEYSPYKETKTYYTDGQVDFVEVINHNERNQVRREDIYEDGQLTFYRQYYYDEKHNYLGSAKFTADGEYVEGYKQ